MYDSIGVIYSYTHTQTYTQRSICAVGANTFESIGVIYSYTYTQTYTL